MHYLKKSVFSRPYNLLYFVLNRMFFCFNNSAFIFKIFYSQNVCTVYCILKLKTKLRSSMRTVYLAIILVFWCGTILYVTTTIVPRSTELTLSLKFSNFGRMKMETKWSQLKVYFRIKVEKRSKLGNWLLRGYSEHLLEQGFSFMVLTSFKS